MRVLFYQLSRDTAESLIGKLAPRIVGAGNAGAGSTGEGERLLVVSADPDQRRRVSEALWSSGEESFLANGHADEPHATRQPILLSEEVQPINGATALALLDGQWREPGDAFTRVSYFFDSDTVDAARQVWRDMRGREGVEKEFWKQDGGRWIKAA